MFRARRSGSYCADCMCHCSIILGQQSVHCVEASFVWPASPSLSISLAGDAPSTDTVAHRGKYGYLSGRRIIAASQHGHQDVRPACLLIGPCMTFSPRRVATDWLNDLEHAIRELRLKSALSGEQERTDDLLRSAAAFVQHLDDELSRRCVERPSLLLPAVATVEDVHAMCASARGLIESIED